MDALIATLERASAYNKNDQAAPVVVLWPDKERQWEPLLPRLRACLPIFTLGAYTPEQRIGPAYWLRAVIARTLPDDQLPTRVTPILYLPGVSKTEIRAVDDSPRALQPLAELQYRGTLWTQKNGRDWTLAAFVQSADGGLNIPLGGDNATREALQRALPKLADESIARLKNEAPLRASFFDELLNPDETRALLVWLNNPATVRASRDASEWMAFCGLCQRKYDFHPDNDGPISAARLLGLRQGAWEIVWRRFAEAPTAYPNIPALLRQARPTEQLSLFDFAESWPQENETAETTLRERLTKLRNVTTQQAYAEIETLEQTHAPRREWVWRRLGQAPLAIALEHLAALARLSRRTLNGESVAEIAAAYAEWGWQCDDAALATLAAVERSEDVAAIKAPLTAIYRPWLEAAALSLQRLVLQSDKAGVTLYPAGPHITASDGTCLIFCDALRFDLGSRLATSLRANGHGVDVATHLAALPTLTSTAKPAISPIRTQLTGSTGLTTAVRDNGVKLTAETMRKLLAEMDYQILKGDETGDPTGKAWTEQGKIDSYGHEHGWRIAQHIQGELQALERRVSALLEAGWSRVLVITDHGWLMAPDGLPKVELAEHLTTVRKGRCARLKAGSSVDQLIVEWYWNPEVRIAYAPGISCYEAGKEYEHGGLSPQECVTPLLTVTSGAPTAVRAPVAIERVVWRGLRCSFQVTNTMPDMMIDIRTKPGDPTTSLASEPKPVATDGTASLLIVDEDRVGEEAVIVVLSIDGIVRAQSLTTIGG